MGRGGGTKLYQLPLLHLQGSPSKETFKGQRCHSVVTFKIMSLPKTLTGVCQSIALTLSKWQRIEMSPYLWHFTNDTLLELSLRMPPRNDKFSLMKYYCMPVTSVWDTYAV